MSRPSLRAVELQPLTRRVDRPASKPRLDGRLLDRVLEMNPALANGQSRETVERRLVGEAWGARLDAPADPQPVAADGVMVAIHAVLGEQQRQWQEQQEELNEKMAALQSEAAAVNQSVANTILSVLGAMGMKSLDGCQHRFPEFASFLQKIGL